MIASLEAPTLGSGTGEVWRYDATTGFERLWVGAYATNTYRAYGAGEALPTIRREDLEAMARQLREVERAERRVEHVLARHRAWSVRPAPARRVEARCRGALGR